MTLLSSVTLFCMLAALAALPTASVALVVTRSALSGLPHGLAVAAGIVVGDLLFMSMAILGMAALAAELGALFALIRYAAAAYLIWFGIGLVRSGFARRREAPEPAAGLRRGGVAASFGAGLLLTLGDVKAIFFYASLLPSLLDLAALSAGDIGWLASVTILSVGGVKILYALAAKRLAARTRGFAALGRIKSAAGAFFVAAGGYLLLKG